VILTLAQAGRAEETLVVPLKSPPLVLITKSLDVRFLDLFNMQVEIIGYIHKKEIQGITRYELHIKQNQLNWSIYFKTKKTPPKKVEFGFVWIH
jgi:hypothetical protein